MPYLQREGYRIHYRWDGDRGAPVLLLSHSLGAHLGLWEPQVERLGAHFHLLRYDLPGHGASDPRRSPATVADMGADAVALLDELGLRRVSCCGLSLGGMVGLWLGAHAPHRLTRLVVSSAAARIEDSTLLRGRIATARARGLEAIADDVVSAWFTRRFAAFEPGRMAWAKRMLLSTGAEAYAATAETVCDADLREELARIRLPVLVLYGSEDRATPAAWCRAVQVGIAGAMGVCLPAAHLVNVEAADAFTSEVRGFLA